MSNGLYQQEIRKVLNLWNADAIAFARSFNVPNKDGDIVPFRPTEPQRRVFTAIDQHNKVMVLKGRQMFVTTATLIAMLRHLVRFPDNRACLAAHDDKSSVEVGNFIAKLHSLNPTMVHLCPITRRRDHVIQFANGSRILIGTANSEFWRGFPTHFAHLTEAAMYDSLGDTLASLGQTVPKGGRIVIETTAKGENDFYGMWQDTDIGYHKEFLCWKDHYEYVDDRPLPHNLTQDERNYILKHKLNKGQAAWSTYKRREMPPDKRNMFDQEYPASPELAFLLSGNKFLPRAVPVAAAIMPDAMGAVRIKEFDPKHQYAAGADVASGSATGDYSTLVIGDVTTREVVFTVQTRMPVTEFADHAMEWLKEYGMPTTAIEINSYGLVVASKMREEGFPLYRNQQDKGLTSTLRDFYGWETNAQTRPLLYSGIYDSAIGQNPWTIKCSRLVDELNALAYDESGKPGAPKNKHDDLAVAFGLMTQAVAQAMPPGAREQIRADQEPKSITEEIEYIRLYGYDSLKRLRDVRGGMADTYAYASALP